MSKCPLQIYLNEKYFESCPSVRPSNDVVKKSLKECYESKYKTQKHEPRNALETDKIANNFFNHHKDKSILKEYLAEHRKSIEAYHDLQKKQEEVLNLCKEKLAKRFPSYMNAILKDDDIIKALRIAENEYSFTQEHKSCDQLVQAILNVIMSSENQQLNSQNCIPNNEQITFQRKDKKFRTEVSVSEYFNSKRKSMIRKILGLFIKQQNRNGAYLTCSDNYFNNSRYIVNASRVGLLSRYPKRSDCKNPYSNCNYSKKTFKHFLHKLAGDSWHTEKGVVSESSGTSVTTNFNKRMKNRNYLTYYCNYQKDVDLLKSEIRKQQDEIKSIQKNLKRCLHILSRFEEKSNNNQKFLKHETQAFHVFTNEYRGFQNPAEPYARFYGQYRAEGDLTYADQKSSSSKDNQLSNSSNDRMTKKCCCFKKKSKKQKQKPKKHSKELQTTPQDSRPKSSVKENQTSDVKFSEELVKVENADDDGFETVKSGDGSDAKAKTSSDTITPDETKKRRCCCKKRDQKKKAKSRIKKRKIRDKGSKTKKKDKESKADITKDGKPRRRSCFIRFCKFLFCSSCCT